MSNGTNNSANRALVIGFMGSDQPGLVHTISDIVSAHNGNWLESKMGEIAGRFAGMALLEVDSDAFDKLKAALESIEGISSVVEEGDYPGEIQNTRVLELNIVGPDRPGIIYDVTQALEKFVANVSEMETHVSAAPMSGELTFSADASILVPFEMDWAVIADQLDLIADNLGIDIMLEEEPDQ